MDKLLECAEVNFRMLCDLIQYQLFKEAGAVSSVDEFLYLVHSGDACDIRAEDAD